MQDEYDFSRAERGEFYRSNAKLTLPVYLDEEVLNFVQGIAEKRDTDVSTVVNELIRSDMQLANIVK